MERLQDGQDRTEARLDVTIIRSSDCARHSNARCEIHRYIRREDGGVRRVGDWSGRRWGKTPSSY
jgi:hypothetical protein